MTLRKIVVVKATWSKKKSKIENRISCRKSFLLSCFRLVRFALLSKWLRGRQSHLCVANCECKKKFIKNNSALESNFKLSSDSVRGKISLAQLFCDIAALSRLVFTPFLCVTKHENFFRVARIFAYKNFIIHERWRHQKREKICARDEWIWINLNLNLFRIREREEESKVSEKHIKWNEMKTHRIWQERVCYEAFDSLADSFFDCWGKRRNSRKNFSAFPRWLSECRRRKKGGKSFHLDEIWSVFMMKNKMFAKLWGNQLFSSKLFPP